MILTLLLLNTLACATTFWVTGSFLLFRDPGRCVKQWVMQLGLLMMMVGAFTNGVGGLKYPFTLGWWDVIFTIGVAAVALIYYDRGFGIKRQLYSTLHRLNTLPDAVAAWFRARWQEAHRRVREKQQ